LNLKGFAAEDYRHQIQVKTREAMRQKAAKGHVTGGKVLGYRNVRDSSHVRLVVDADQAGIVRRIFTMAAEGKGLLKIAKTLNAEGVVNPTGQQRPGSKKAARYWSPNGIRSVLHRELYLGRPVWGRERRMDKGGKGVMVATQESEWIKRDAPELRIVDEKL